MKRVIITAAGMPVRTLSNVLIRISASHASSMHPSPIIGYVKIVIFFEVISDWLV
jgi:hypothetical protein